MNLWTFGFSNEDQARLRVELPKAGWPEPRAIRPEWAAATVQEILDGLAQESEPWECSERLILFEAWTDRDISRFIEWYLHSRFPQPLWAAVTEISRRWIFSVLLEDLIKERALLEHTEDFSDLV
jgi:hypothetical protein